MTLTGNLQHSIWNKKIWVTFSLSHTCTHTTTHTHKAHTIQTHYHMISPHNSHLFSSLEKMIYDLDKDKTHTTHAINWSNHIIPATATIQKSSLTGSTSYKYCFTYQFCRDKGNREGRRKTCRWENCLIHRLIFKIEHPSVISRTGRELLKHTGEWARSRKGVDRQKQEGRTKTIWNKFWSKAKQFLWLQETGKALNFTVCSMNNKKKKKSKWEDSLLWLIAAGFDRIAVDGGEGRAGKRGGGGVGGIFIFEMIMKTRKLNEKLLTWQEVGNVFSTMQGNYHVIILIEQQLLLHIPKLSHKIKCPSWIQPLKTVYPV